MLSDEEKKAIEQAISSVTRGVDIESAILILEKCDKAYKKSLEKCERK